MRGGEADEATLDRLAAELDVVLSSYNEVLAKQKFIGGDEFTLADIFHLPYGQMARDIGYKDVMDKYPNVKKWFDTISSRESWIKVKSGKA